jgi:hypothetical protein
VPAGTAGVRMSDLNGNGRPRHEPEAAWEAHATEDGVDVVLPAGKLVVLTGDEWRLLTPSEAMHLVSSQTLRDALRRASVRARAGGEG